MLLIHWSRSFLLTKYASCAMNNALKQNLSAVQLRCSRSISHEGFWCFHSLHITRCQRSFCSRAYEMHELFYCLRSFLQAPSLDSPHCNKELAECPLAVSLQKSSGVD